MQARELVIQLLNRTEAGESYSNLLLDTTLARTDLDVRDRNLCKLLYYGTLKRRITLDAVLEKYVRKSLKKLDLTVHNILRLGIYQLLYCDQIPQHAAVNESVQLTKSFRKSNASGFVNAVLRNFLRDDCQIPYPEDPIQAMSVKYAAPIWLIERLLSMYGEDRTRNFLADTLQTPPCYIRRNPICCTAAQLEQALGNKISAVSILPDAYLLRNSEDLRQMTEFQSGWFYVQDLSSQLCAVALDAKPNETVLDLCAAPGGKTCTAAIQMQQSGTVYAYDVAENRLQLIQDNVRRLHLQNVVVRKANATQFQSIWEQKADRVLCDVPCSGFGVLRRKPEIKYKTMESIQDLPKLQLQILENGARYVRPGGILQYSTCTIFLEENENVVQQFLDAHAEFQLEPIAPQVDPRLQEGQVTMLPEMYGGDGFFIAKFRRHE